jgi:energy-coupling factor transporter ATP-binding protein EcfA2/GNAT superfamily N-acetyltransferase
MKHSITQSVEIVRSARVLQLEGLFDVPPSQQSESTWDIDLPIEGFDWQIGLIVGASGSGKSTLAREAFPGVAYITANTGYEWPEDRAVVDGFPAEQSIKDVTAALSSVGFSSPPAWLRPFRCLSTGEQFRATVARALCDPAPLVVIDEFTSVVDRTVAQIGSAAVAKAIRRTPGKQVVCVSCHYDVEPWLCPDWTLEMPSGTFARRSLQRRPPVDLEIARVHPSAWELFSRHHYMSAEHHPNAKCFCAFLRDQPVAFCSVIHFPHQNGGWWKEHRTVVLPDFQGVGIGNALSEFVASLFKATCKPYRDVTAHPGHVHHRAKSSLWKVTRQMSRMRPQSRKTTLNRGVGTAKTVSSSRLTMSFEYVGPARPEEARKFGLI